MENLSPEPWHTAEGEHLDIENHTVEKRESGCGESPDLRQQLHESQERYRQLFLQEQRRARHLSLINEVQKCALVNRDLSQFLAHVVRAIGVHFRGCDVSIYLSRATLHGLQIWILEEVSEDSSSPESENAPPSSSALATLNAQIAENDPRGADELVLVAAFGDASLGARTGSTLPKIEAVSRGEIGDWSPLFHPESQARLHTPVSIDNEIGGLVVVQSRDADAIDARDNGALGTASAIIGSYVQNARLFASMRETGEFNKELLNSMLHSLLVVDSSGDIQFINQRLLQTFGRTREETLRAPLETIFGDGPATHHHLREEIAALLENGQSREIPEVHVWTGESERVFDLRLFRVYFRGQAEAALLLINITPRWRKTYQLQLMHEIGRLFQESLEIDRVLSTVLTCITAGSALGFNRAFVFLFDDAGENLEGRNALGPSSSEEASRIWGEISQREFTLSELLEQSEALRDDPTPLQKHTRSLQINPKNPCFAALRAALDAKTAVRIARGELLGFDSVLCAHSDESSRAEANRLGDLLLASEVAVAPLVAKERLVGVVFADNLFSGAPI